MTKRYVIIGAGAAGSHAALEIRKHDRSGSITLISEEPYSLYHKYAMMDYLCDQISKQELFQDTIGRFNARKIHLRLSQQVRRINLKKRMVHLDHRESLPYDVLLLATGVKATVHPAYRRFQKHLTCVNSLDDIEKLKARQSSLERPLILGGSLTAIRLALALRNSGNPVDYLLFHKMTGSLLAGANDFDQVRHLLKEKGVSLFEQTDITGMRGSSKGIKVSFSHGIQRVYSIVFAGFGVEPEKTLAEKTGIACEQGILVDEYFRTNHASIFAAGDVAQIYNPKLRDYWVNFGWPNAVKQGTIAGQNMSGMKKAYQPARVNVLALGGKEINFRNWQ
jgi:NAD(P)H-nitrite reductase large subunit